MRFTGRKFERCIRIGSPPGAHFARARASSDLLVEIAVDEIRYHVDGPLDFKFSQRAVSQVIRYGGDAVALLDREARDGQIAAVAAHQRDVRPVQGGDEGQAPRRGHHAREQRAYRMGNRVVNVQQIERGCFGNFGHFGRQRQRVRRMVEQRIRGDFYLMKRDAVARSAEANGHRVADEMHIVPARGQFDAEFGGHHAGTAVRGIASDSDFHVSDGRRGDPNRQGEDTLLPVGTALCSLVAVLVHVADAVLVNHQIGAAVASELDAIAVVPLHRASKHFSIR